MKDTVLEYCAAKLKAVYHQEREWKFKQHLLSAADREKQAAEYYEKRMLQLEPEVRQRIGVSEQ